LVRKSGEYAFTSKYVKQTNHSARGSKFASQVRAIRDRGDWDAGFVDALCDPPESFSYGGMLAHVTTFAAYRRSLAIAAFRQLAVEDLGIGDPMGWERSLA
jgi:AraC family transcriptional regulator